MSTRDGGAPKPSKVEVLKESSDYLRGPLPEELASGEPSVGDDALQVLKFHGTYQQDDRDVRIAASSGRAGEAAYQFMVRIRMPGGRLDARQYLACDELARDGRQRHAADHDPAGVPAPRRPQARPEGDDPPINEALLDTLAACGDVERNVLCCPAPIHDAVRAADAGRLPTGSPRTSRPGPRATGTSGSTARRSTTRDCPEARPGPGADRRRRPGRADLRQGLPAPQVQDGLRPARRQLHRRPRQRPRLPRRRRGRRARRLQRPGRRRPGHHAERPEDLPGRRACRSATSPATTSCGSARRSSRSSARLRQPLRPQAGPAQVRDLRLGDAPPSGRRSRSTSAAPLDPAPRAGAASPRSTTTSAGTSRATASSSSASRSRTAGSRTRATSGSPAASGRSSSGTAPRPG